MGDDKLLQHERSVTVPLIQPHSVVFTWTVRGLNPGRDLRILITLTRLGPTLPPT